jgi:hypothetical protein
MDLKDNLILCLEQYWIETRFIFTQLSGIPTPINTISREDLWNSSIGKLFQILLLAASKKIDRSDLDNLNIVMDAIKIVRFMFFERLGSPELDKAVFSRSIGNPIGKLLLQAEMWVDRDDLITISEASRLTGYSLQDLSNRIARGKLTYVIDENEKNPTYAKRLLFSQVLRLYHETHNIFDLKIFDEKSTQISNSYLKMSGTVPSNLIFTKDFSNWFYDILGEIGKGSKSTPFGVKIGLVNPESDSDSNE